MNVQELMEAVADKPRDALVVISTEDGFASPLRAAFDGKYKGDEVEGVFFYTEDIADNTDIAGAVLCVMLQPKFH
jgi:hypothetical protein